MNRKIKYVIPGVVLCLGIIINAAVIRLGEVKIIEGLELPSWSLNSQLPEANVEHANIPSKFESLGKAYKYQTQESPLLGLEPQSSQSPLSLQSSEPSLPWDSLGTTLSEVMMEKKSDALPPKRRKIVQAPEPVKIARDSLPVEQETRRAVADNRPVFYQLYYDDQQAEALVADATILKAGEPLALMVAAPAVLQGCVLDTTVPRKGRITRVTRDSVFAEFPCESVVLELVSGDGQPGVLLSDFLSLKQQRNRAQELAPENLSSMLPSIPTSDVQQLDQVLRGLQSTGRKALKDAFQPKGENSPVIIPQGYRVMVKKKNILR